MLTRRNKPQPLHNYYGHVVAGLPPTAGQLTADGRFGNPCSILALSADLSVPITQFVKRTRLPQIARKNACALPRPPNHFAACTAPSDTTDAPTHGRRRAGGGSRGWPEWPAVKYLPLLSLDYFNFICDHYYQIIYSTGRQGVLRLAALARVAFLQSILFLVLLVLLIMTISMTMAVTMTTIITVQLPPIKQ